MVGNNNNNHHHNNNHNNHNNHNKHLHFSVTVLCALSSENNFFIPTGVLNKKLHFKMVVSRCLHNHHMHIRFILFFSNNDRKGENV